LEIVAETRAAFFLGKFTCKPDQYDSTMNQALPKDQVAEILVRR